MTLAKWATSFLVMLTLSAPIVLADEILPKTPEDWKYERIEFPLTFAPDISHKGFEELRFAPGMFNAKSETYFTYIFALQLEGQHKVDAEFLKDLLTKYYRGLCSTVWGDDDNKPDFSTITVEVTADDSNMRARRFKAKINMIDAFVTRKPLILHVDIQFIIDSANKRTRLFAQASPKPTDHKIWKLLRTFAQPALH